MSARRLLILASHTPLALLFAASVLPAGAQDRPVDPAEPVAAPRVDTTSSPAAASLSPTAWTAIGPAPVLNGSSPGNGPTSGRLTGIAAHPTDANIIYVASAGGGIWKTTNGGTSWTPVTESSPIQMMGAVAIAPSNPSVVYAGTGEANFKFATGMGILVSTDAGATWTLRNAGGAIDYQVVAQIVVHPTSANVAYAATAFDGVIVGGASSGIYKTTNGGVTWTNMTAAITTTEPFTGVQMDPTQPSTLYAAVSRRGPTLESGVYKSTDSGATWVLLTNGLTYANDGDDLGRIAVAVSPSNPQVLYVSSSHGRDTDGKPYGSLYKLLRSDNGGATFTDLTSGTPNYLGAQGGYDTALTVDPSNASIVIAAGQSGVDSIIRSTDGGLTWSSLYQGTDPPYDGPHADHHAGVFDASGRFLDGNDGGIHRLDTASPVHWTSLNTNLSTIQFTGIALHPTDPNIAIGGTQDNGTDRFTGSQGWTRVEGGDGGAVRFSRTNPSRVYRQAPIPSFGPANFIRRSDDAGVTWVSKVNGITDTTGNQHFYAPMVIDPSDGNRLVFGGVDVWETTDGAESWHGLNSPSVVQLSVVALAPSDQNTIYAATVDQVFYTSNRGASWQARPQGGLYNVTDMQVSPVDPLTVYATSSFCRSCFGPHVLKTTDGGNTWVDISDALPDIPVWSLRIDPTGPGRLFVGAEDGVYATVNDGVSWTRVGTGFPRAQVFEVDLNLPLGILAAATHGRGTWELAVPPAYPPSVSPQPAAAIMAGGAQLRTAVTPNGYATTAWFNYGSANTYGSSTPVQNMGPGSSALAVSGGTITGLTCNTTYHYRAVAASALGTIYGTDSTFTTAPCASGASVVQNGSFGSGSSGWLQFATPDNSYIVTSTSGGVMQFYRVAPPPGTSNQAVVFQETGLALAASAPVIAQFDLGNSSSVRKRITVLVHDSTFDDLSVCTFWLPPNQPLTTYGVRTHTTRAWSNATISFYAASVGASGGAYLLDNVSLVAAPTSSATDTQCVDPLVSAPTAGVTSASFLTNGDFGSGTLPPWSLYGTISGEVASGEFQFVRTAGIPAGVILQSTGQTTNAGDVLTASFELGNSSPVRKRVTVLLHDLDFSDLAACTFWLQPSTPMATYQMRGFATEAWGNATFSLYGATVGTEAWIRFDSATLQRTPGAVILGTECVEPAAPVSGTR